MFDEWLSQHDLLHAMKGTEGCPFPRKDDRAAWSRVDPALLKSLRNMRDKYRSVAYPPLLATQFMAFVRDGSRKTW